MAKYKQPTNEKHKSRKDLKDYTMEKDVHGMVPNASGEKMPEVPRKDDKEVIDDVENMIPTTKDADKIYVTKQMQDGDGKMSAHALKTLVKNQEEDAKELIDTLSKKDGGYMTQIEKLTKEQKEKLVREIVKRKVSKFLSEQALNTIKTEADEEAADAEKETPTETPPAEELPASQGADDTQGQTVSQDADATPAADATKGQDDASGSQDETSPEDDPADDAAATEDETINIDDDPRVNNFVKAIEQKEGALQQIKTLMKVIKHITKNQDEKRRKGILGLLKRVVDKSLYQAD